MTTPADATAAEEAFEACLAGRPVPEGAKDLAAFTHAVRAGATAPGRPNAALADLLATGLLIHPQEPSPGTAGPRARTSRKRPRMILTSLVVKIASAGALAKTAAGAGVVAIALTGASTAGVLPGQEDPPAVVESGDPTVPEVVEDTPPVVEGDPGAVGEPSAVDGTPVGGETPDPADDAAGAPVGEGPADDVVEGETARAHPENFGATVSQAAHDGDVDVDGQEISGLAHERNAQRKADRAPEPVVGETPVVPAPDEQPVVAPTAPEQPAPAGNGRGNGRK